MVRLSAIFVAFCMVLIAMSIGVVLFLAFNLSGAQSLIVAICALTALALYDLVAKQLRSRSMIGEQIGNLSRGTADLAWQVGDLTRQVTECSRRITAIERKTEIPLERTRAAIPAINTEIDELGGIVKQLAEAVASHETRFAAENLITEHTITDYSITVEQPAVQAEPEPTPVSGPAQVVARVENDEPESDTPLNLNTTSSPSAATHQSMVALVTRILDANRADIYLQPIVTLPQRKIRYYEAFTRLRGEDGELLQPIDFILAAERGGLMPRIDLLILSRAAQVVRRLLQKNRDIGLICNVSAYTLIDRAACRQLQEFMQAHQELASSLLLEFPQSVWRAMSPFERECVAGLAQLGVRFSMDHVADLRMDPKEMADRGIRLVKTPAKLLLDSADKSGLDIVPSDLANLLARYGVDLIAEKIEAENTVLELFDYDLRFGQGYLFSAPRPVRPEALQGLSEEDAADNHAPSIEMKSQGKPASVRRKIAKAVEQISRKGIVPKPAPGGSNA